MTVDDDGTPALEVADVPVTVQEQGPGVEFRVRLSAEPVSPVTVRVSGYAGTDVRVTPSERRFTADNWEAFQTFSVRAVDDTDAVTDPVVTLMLEATGSAEYAALAQSEVEVTVEENDTPSLRLSTQKLDVPEDGSRSFTVLLNTKPSGNVEVRVTWGSGSDLTVTGPGNADLGAGGVLIFTDTDWNAAQRVTVAAGVDDDAANDLETLTLRASGADYGSAPSAEVMVTVDDDETVALAVTGSPVTVQENAATAVEFTVALATQPLGSVTVRVTGHAGTDVRVSPETATFTTDNWGTPQTFEVRAGDDSDSQNETVTLALMLEGSAEYAALAAQEVRVSVQDDDVPGVRLSATALDMAEGGRASYRVKLTAQPTGAVEVRVTGMSGTDLTLLGWIGRSVETLAFTPENWDLDQIVDVVVGTDADAADDVVVLRHRASGADYGSAPVQELTVTVADGSMAGLELSTRSVTVQEQGPAVEFAVRLASAPMSRVSVAVTGHSGTEVRVSPGSLSFSASDWRTPKTFQVRADGDADAVDEAVVTLLLAATGSAEYEALPASEVAVAVEDDDVPALRLSASAVTVPEGGSVSYTLRLTTAPTADVTVLSSIISGYGVTRTDRHGNDGFELVFTPSNWSVGQQLTLTAESDEDAADGAAEVRHWVSIGSPEYPYGLDGILPVTVDDDETAALVVSKRSLRVPLSGAAETFEVSLATPPATGGAVVEALVPKAAAASFTVNPPWLSFTYNNWDSPQTVTVTGAFRSAVGDTGVLRLVPRHSPEYAALAPVGLAMTVTAAVQAQLAPPVVTGTPSVTGPSADGAYAANERIEARVAFDAPVVVDSTGDAPTLGLGIGGVRREASYESGSGTAELVFALTVASADAGAGAAKALANGLRLNGATIQGEGGTDAVLGFGSAPGVTGVTVAEAPGGDGGWDAGDTVEVRLTFAEPMVVDTTSGRPTVGLDLGGARSAAYARGSGTSTLVFAWTLGPSEARQTFVLVTPNSLALNGGTIRSTGGLDAGLEHVGAGSTVVLRTVPAIDVADAQAPEGGTLIFRVTLAPAPSGPVTVAYATRDGTAVAGDDYVAASGTVVFAANETQKTVEVTTLDDIHDDNGETLTLTLSDPQGAELGDGVATGTITNTDPMPQAWLARFGRTVAEQVIDAVEGRFAAHPSPGAEVSLAGVQLGDASAEAVETLEAREAAARLEALSRWLTGDEDEADAETAQSRAFTGRDFLTGTSFALTGGTAEGGFASVWGRGAVSYFDGRDGDLTLDGEVESAMLGADFTREVATVGLMVMHSRGEGSYRGQGEGTVESTLTGLYPYGRYALNERVTVWGAAGYGEGEFTLTPKDAPAIETEMDLAMGAVGVRGVALEPPADGGLEVAVNSDALAVRTASDSVDGGDGGKLVGADADVTRLRLGLEGTWRGVTMGRGGALTPRLELGVRHDGGDAETGFGVDAGAGLVWVNPGSGLSAELSARGLLTHESDGFRDRGIAGSLAWDPRPDSNRGFSLTVSQTMGAAAAGGMDALLGRETLEGLAANDEGDDLANRRLEVGLGYGFGVFGDRFTATPEVELGLSNGQREYRLGWRLGLERGGPVSMELGLDATRHEAANDEGEAVNALMLRGSVRW